MVCMGRIVYLGSCVWEAYLAGCIWVLAAISGPWGIELKGICYHTQIRLGTPQTFGPGGQIFL